MDVDRNGVGAQLVAHAVELLFQYGLGHDPSETADQVLQDGDLLPGERHDLAVDFDIAPHGVEHQIAGLQANAERPAGTP